MTWDIAKRGPKVFIDHNQNVGGKTIASVYSARPFPGAPVSTPVLWDELDGLPGPNAFTIDTIWSRLSRYGDLFAPVLRGGQTLDAAERERYARHLTIPEVGEAGQLKLGESRVLLVGAGGLGEFDLVELRKALTSLGGGKIFRSFTRTQESSILGELVQTPRYRSMEVERAILREELLDATEPEFWEVVDRGRNFDFLPAKMREQIKQELTQL